MTNERFKELVKDGFYVKVDNKEEAMCVLKMCEKHDIKWVTGGKALSYKPNVYPYFLHIHKDWTNDFAINYLNAKNKDYMTNPEHKIINIKEFTYPKQEIHITRKGNETHAVLKQDGKVIKHAVAKCHPDDEYSFGMGSFTAYNKLQPIDDNLNTSPIFQFFRQIEKEMDKAEMKTIDEESKPQFKVGDIVRIRQWNDMVKEFGTSDSKGLILCDPIPFCASMSKYCGKLCKIVSIDKNETRIRLKLDFLNKELNNDIWSFTTDMIEPYQPRQAKIGEYVMVIADFENVSDKFKKGTILKRSRLAEYEYD